MRHAGPWPWEPRMKKACTPASRYQSVSFSTIGRSGSPLPSKTAGIGATNPRTVLRNSFTPAIACLLQFVLANNDRQRFYRVLIFFFAKQAEALEYRPVRDGKNDRRLFLRYISKVMPLPARNKETISRPPGQ